MIQRKLLDNLLMYLDSFPVVALLGPRQCGKSTLAKMMITESDKWVYLDLERPSDVTQISDPELYFNSIGSKNVCIDEVQLRPDLFPVLRSIVDEDNRNGKILLLGSASPELLRQGSETLAGRIGFLELSPFSLDELTKVYDVRHHWLSGGYPRSVLSKSGDVAFIWLENYLKTYVERDLVNLGLKLTSSEVLRFLTMCAHSQGQLFNSSKFGESMSVARQTLTRWLDVLMQTFMVRKLEPYEANVKKRLVKTPKVFIRDSGILHALLRVHSFQELMGHPIFGSSWEGYAIENIISKFPRWDPTFYRTSNGAELDLILSKGLKKIAFEFKASVAPKLSRGFWSALEDVEPDFSWIVVPEGDSYPIADTVWVISLEDFLLKEIEESNLTM